MFTTVTQVECQPGKLDDMLIWCLSLLDETSKCEGCLKFELHHDVDDANTLVFIADWQDELSWQAHIDSPRQRELAEEAASPERLTMMVGWRSQRLVRIQ